MQRRTSAASLLTSVDELFTTQAERDEAKLEKIQLIPLEELKPFRDHPFKVTGITAYKWRSLSTYIRVANAGD